jgi:hypothetical protein
MMQALCPGKRLVLFVCICTITCFHSLASIIARAPLLRKLTVCGPTTASHNLDLVLDSPLVALGFHCKGIERLSLSGPGFGDHEAWAAVMKGCLQLANLHVFNAVEFSDDCLRAICIGATAASREGPLKELVLDGCTILTAAGLLNLHDHHVTESLSFGLPFAAHELGGPLETTIAAAASHVKSFSLTSCIRDDSFRLDTLLSTLATNAPCLTDLSLLEEDDPSERIAFWPAVTNALRTSVFSLEKLTLDGVLAQVDFVLLCCLWVFMQYSLCF